MQPTKESSAAGRCAGRGCALTRQLANCRWRSVGGERREDGQSRPGDEWRYDGA